MLVCEGLTIRGLRGRYINKDDDENTIKIDELVTRYLNDKPGNWRLINATTSEFGWYFIWSKDQ